MQINISEAKANLSKLVNMAHAGEKVVILKNNIPLVDIVAHEAEPTRKLGLLLGQLDLPNSLMDEDDKINEMFYGSDR
ncbi:MAG TPA: type II toxin-antitoxin system prevent-host-death family antitoxin [Oceanospirillaceae bacterium]|jgi:antitoxin (DNA-binding transcriptional repressor) of toxin-antitoxin stability system|nr:type II toxin-antitoxin system prevent-host-death family antitoxin [Oceanospirillaceae bacterium]